eukprot:PhF_6_TR22572/c0_g1_i2/m.32143
MCCSFIFLFFLILVFQGDSQSPSPCITITASSALCDVLVPQNSSSSVSCDKPTDFILYSVINENPFPCSEGMPIPTQRSFVNIKCTPGSSRLPFMYLIRTDDNPEALQSVVFRNCSMQGVNVVNFTSNRTSPKTDMEVQMHGVNSVGKIIIWNVMKFTVTDSNIVRRSTKSDYGLGSMQTITAQTNNDTHYGGCLSIGSYENITAVSLQNVSFSGGVSSGGGGCLNLYRVDIVDAQDLSFRGCSGAGSRGGCLAITETQDVLLRNVVGEYCQTNFAGGGIVVEIKGTMWIRDIVLRYVQARETSGMTVTQGRGTIQNLTIEHGSATSHGCLAAHVLEDVVISGVVLKNCSNLLDELGLVVHYALNVVFRNVQVDGTFLVTDTNGMTAEQAMFTCRNKALCQNEIHASTVIFRESSSEGGWYVTNSPTTISLNYDNHHPQMTLPSNVSVLDSTLSCFNRQLEFEHTHTVVLTKANIMNCAVTVNPYITSLIMQSSTIHLLEAIRYRVNSTNSTQRSCFSVQAGDPSRTPYFMSFDKVTFNCTSVRTVMNKPITYSNTTRMFLSELDFWSPQKTSTSIIQRANSEGGSERGKVSAAVSMSSSFFVVATMLDVDEVSGSSSGGRIEVLNHFALCRTGQPLELTWVLHPTQLEIGDHFVSPYFGAIVANSALTLIIFAFTFITSTFFPKWGLGCPGMALRVEGLYRYCIIASGLNVIVHGGKEVIGFTIVSVIILIVYAVLMTCVFFQVYRSDSIGTGSPQFVPFTVLTESCMMKDKIPQTLQFLFWRKGIWTPSNAPVLRNYGAMISMSCPNRLWFPALSCVISVVIAGLTAKVGDEEACEVVGYAVAIVLGFEVLCNGLLQPQRVLRNNVTTVLMSTFELISVVTKSDEFILCSSVLRFVNLAVTMIHRSLESKSQVRDSKRKSDGCLVESGSQMESAEPSGLWSAQQQLVELKDRKPSNEQSLL